MNQKQIERAAYIAAHRILRANTNAPELACPGARRSHAVDTIANIIQGVFEVNVESMDECPTRPLAEAAKDTTLRRRAGFVIEIPQRVS